MGSIRDGRDVVDDAIEILNTDDVMMQDIDEGMMLPPPISSTFGEAPPSPNLAHLIQQKRRQASAPFFTSARSSTLFSPGNGFGVATKAGEEVSEEVRRVRSRQPSRLGLSLSALRIPDEVPSGISTGLVMTPTTEVCFLVQFRSSHSIHSCHATQCQ